MSRRIRHDCRNGKTTDMSIKASDTSDKKQEQRKPAK